ncbi:MAG: MerR family transcriptional regulator [Desulfomonilaceae bacterium]
MKTLYSATAVAKKLSLNPARLQRWLNFGHFKPEYRAMLGDTMARLFTEKEVQHLKAVVDLIDSGVSVQDAFARIDSSVREI